MNSAARIALALFAAASFACSKGAETTPVAKTAETKAPAKTPAKKPGSQPGSQPKSQPSHAAGKSSEKGLSSADRDAADDDGVVRRGFALSDTAVLTVAECHDKAESLKGKSVKVKGEVTQVCSKAGCWFMLREGDKKMRITSKGYKYFVPKDAVGMTAIVEGELSAKELDQKTAQHYADDEAAETGKPAEKITGPVFEVAIASVGLEMTKQ